MEKGEKFLQMPQGFAGTILALIGVGALYAFIVGMIARALQVMLDPRDRAQRRGRPPVRRVSSTNAPSRIEISRSTVAAIRSSCVTITSVCPLKWS
jgi:hypothetical protein